MRSSTKGFTLIELAVVIAIIAILAAVAIPRFGDTTTQAERSMIKDMVNQLTSAAANYTAEQGATPTDFNSFVETSATTATSPKTISIKSFGGGACSSTGATIGSCNFQKWTPTYNWNSGQITVTATGKNNNSNTF
jgi:prepilin-type N-terminal cleavage/methylation domain-containing protein